MQRRIFSLIALFALFPSLSKAQDNRQSKNPGNAPSASSDSTVVSLLQQSHDLNPQFPLSMRIHLLGRQAETMSRVDAELGQAWAQELLALATQTKGNPRSMAQNSAMSILVRLNPDRALLLLHSLSKEEPQEGFTLSLPNRQLVQRVFGVLVERDGVKALPLLEQEAMQIGTDGSYPYGELGHAAMQSVSKEWAGDRPHAVEVVQRVFDRAFERYTVGPCAYADDYEFGRMLQEVSGGISQESVRPALRMLVKNLLATDTSKYRFEAEVYTVDGKTAKVDNAIDAALLNLGGLINRIDSELAQQLEATRPQLQTALEYTRDGRIRMWMFNGNGQLRNPPPLKDPNAETSTDAVRLANINLDAAIARAKEVADDDRRADTMLFIAGEIADKQPERAQELIADVEGSNKTGIPELQLDVISAKTSVTAAQNKKDETRELLQQGFALATPIIVELQKSGQASFVPGLGRLVQIGMQNDPDATIIFLQSVPAPWLRANLLLGAASGLIMQAQRPLGSAGTQESAKSKQ